MKHSESIGALSAALVKAQGELEHAHKGSLNPHFKNHYADLTEVIDTVRPVLNKHGIAFAQFPGYEAGITTVETILTHGASGEWISGTAGARVQKDDPQGVGSAITYLRRYSLAAVCGLGQEDDDGEAASHDRSVSQERPAPRPTPSSQPNGVKHSNVSGQTCPKCGGGMWDNRAKKASGEFKPNSPDFACKDKACKQGVWLEKEAETEVDAVKLQDALDAAAVVGAITVEQSARIEGVIAEGDPDHMSAAMSWLETQMAKKKTA